MALLPFVQFEIAGRIGPPTGRYLRRGVGGDPEANEVVVVKLLGAPRSRGRLRRGRPQAVKDDDATPLPLTRATVTRPEPFGDREAASEWVKRVSRSEDASQAEIERGLRSLNLLLHSHRAATQDPYIRDIGPDDPVAIRVGFGTGDEVVESMWSEIAELPLEQGDGRRAKMEDLQPQERVAASLAGRERIDACETLTLRARCDYDNERYREAALQLQVALGSLLIEVPADPGPDQDADLATLEGRRDSTTALARAALGPDDLDETERAALAETLALCERVLRRRRLLRGMQGPESG